MSDTTFNEGMVGGAYGGVSYIILKASMGIDYAEIPNTMFQATLATLVGFAVHLILKRLSKKKDGNSK